VASPAPSRVHRATARDRWRSSRSAHAAGLAILSDLVRWHPAWVGLQRRTPTQPRGDRSPTMATGCPLLRGPTNHRCVVAISFRIRLPRASGTGSRAALRAAGGQCFSTAYTSGRPTPPAAPAAPPGARYNSPSPILGHPSHREDATTVVDQSAPATRLDHRLRASYLGPLDGARRDALLEEPEEHQNCE
jgi:hypothetical protein